MLESKKKVESYEWVKLEGLDNLPKDRLLKAVIKSPSPEGTTIHPEDADAPIRLFAESEVMKGARTAIGKPVGLNHSKFPIYGAYCVDADWNDIEKQAEAILFVPPEFVKKVESGEISTVSIEYQWRKENHSEQGVNFEGLNITRVDLVEGLRAGDKTASVSKFETTSQTGQMEGQVKVEKVKGESAPTQDPNSAASKPADPPVTPPAEDPKDKRIKELEGAVQIAVTATSDLKNSVDSQIAEAKKEAKREVVKELEQIPDLRIKGMAGQRVMQKLKEVIKQTKKECQ